MISVVVPVFNEELVINETHKRLTGVMAKYEYEIIYVNDGSKDKTANIIREIINGDKNTRMLEFSRNFGHQTAITAGISYACGDAVVIIDADLQDPPEVIPKMIEKWQQGFEVVYGKRLKRKGESFFKKATAKLYYRFLRSMTDMDFPVDTGDFRILDRKICDELKKLPESNRYVRGLVSWIGFNQTYVEYVRDERFAGETKYPLKKMIKFAIDGMTSFSVKPLRLATYVGFAFSAVSFIYLLVVFIQKLFFHSTIFGWASLIAVNLFFNGIVLIILGLIGEYIGRIYDESKNRPLFILKDKVGFDEKD